jgi:hypothetical protein
VQLFLLLVDYVHIEHVLSDSEIVTVCKVASARPEVSRQLSLIVHDFNLLEQTLIRDGASTACWPTDIDPRGRTDEIPLILRVLQQLICHTGMLPVGN